MDNSKLTKTAGNNRFAAMLAANTQHQLLFRLSAAVPADITLLSNRIYFVLWFSIGFSCQADIYQFQHSSKPST